MTRINVVPVWELSDQHLLAEYRELPRVIKQKIDTSDAPRLYKLGAGHVKWARLHAWFCYCRYWQLYEELIYRGFNIKNNPHELYDAYEQVILNGLYYPVDDKDLAINRERLIEKYLMRPQWYKWTKREKPQYLKEYEQ